MSILSKCTKRLIRDFFLFFCIFLRSVVVTAMIMSVFNTLDVQTLYIFFKNEVVDVQNEVEMDICLDITCEG